MTPRIIAGALLLVTVALNQVQAQYPTCETDGSSGGICSQVLTTFCLRSDCSSCCDHINACPPTPSYVKQQQCKVTTTIAPKPTTVPVTVSPCATVFCKSGSCRVVAGYAVCIPTCTGAVYQCIIHPCSTTKCPMHPTATCIGNFCNGCNAHFYLNGNNVTSTCQPKTTTVAVATTQLQCGPVCGIFCMYGNVPDSRGCPTCACRTGPAPATTKPTKPAVTTPVPTKPAVTTPTPTTPAATKPVTVQCPPLCRKLCPYGYVVDSNGCQLCQCLPPPMTTTSGVVRTTPHARTSPRVRTTPHARTSPRVRTTPQGKTSPRVQSTRPVRTTPVAATTPAQNPCSTVRCASGPCINVAGYPVCTSACSGPAKVCAAPPCQNASCPAHPAAVCVNNYCAGCHAYFYVKVVEVTSTCTPPATVCPKSSSVSPVCQLQCSSDSDCSQDGDGCCSVGCSKMCVKKCTKPTCQSAFDPSKCQYGQASDSTSGCPICRCTSLCESQRQKAISSGPQPIGRRRRQAPGSYIPGCEADGSFTVLQCRDSSGYCWCVNPTTGVNTTQHVPPALHKTLPCVPSVATTRDSTSTPTCAPCTQKCVHGVLSDTNANGCSLCLCKPPPDVKIIRLTLTLQSNKALYDALNADEEQTQLKLLALQIRTQLMTRFSIPSQQLAKFTATSKVSEGGEYMTYVSFNVQGNTLNPDPEAVVQKIQESAASKSLVLTFSSSSGQTYDMAVADSSAVAQTNESTDSKQSMYIAIGVAVPAGIILIAILVLVVYKVKVQKDGGRASTVKYEKRLSSAHLTGSENEYVNNPAAI
ncbi:mucin-2-like isoform X2 [Sycon ciliatum]|uniref:mucin-2-like isoform X2 n=1 Tax=Sycon ciliatum TaxID=27933 RepID=UPI0031F67BF7